jgi:addiction module HigA family antidote
MAKQNLSSPSVVLKNLMEEYGLNPSKLAAAVNFNQATLRLIIMGKGKISCPAAFRLAKFFGNTPEYWLNLQNQYDISEAAKDKELIAVLKNIKKAVKAAPAKKEAKTTASTNKAAVKKADPIAKKPGKAAGSASKTAKAPAEKKPSGRKPAANKKTAEARRGRKPAGAKAVPASNNKEIPAPQPDTFSGYPFPETGGGED